MAAAATRLKAGFIPVRKKGKLPYKTIEQDYALEYGHATVALHTDAIKPGARVLLVDADLRRGSLYRVFGILRRGRVAREEARRKYFGGGIPHRAEISRRAEAVERFSRAFPRRVLSHRPAHD